MKQYALEGTFIDFPTCTTIRICILFRRSLQYCLHMHARLWNTLSNSLALKVSMINVKTEYLLNQHLMLKLQSELTDAESSLHKRKIFSRYSNIGYITYLMNSAIFKYLDLCAIFWIFNPVLFPRSLLLGTPRVFALEISRHTYTHACEGSPRKVHTFPPLVRDVGSHMSIEHWF